MLCRHYCVADHTMCCLDSFLGQIPSVNTVINTFKMVSSEATLQCIDTVHLQQLCFSETSEK